MWLFDCLWRFKPQVFNWTCTRWWSTHLRTPVLDSIGASGSLLAKTDKSKVFHHLVEDVDDSTPPPSDETVIVKDGNAVSYDMRELPENFREMSLNIFNAASSWSDVIFRTDVYNTDSVKSREMQRREPFREGIQRNQETGNNSWLTMRTKTANTSPSRWME